MLNILLDACFIFLLLYALFSISTKIANFAVRKPNLSGLHAVIKPEISEDFEYIIRCAATKSLKSGISLIIIDKNLSENEKYIASALKNEFSNIFLLSPEEYCEKYL